MLFKICLVIFTFALRRSSWGPISIRYDNCTNNKQHSYQVWQTNNKHMFITGSHQKCWKQAKYVEKEKKRRVWFKQVWKLSNWPILIYLTRLAPSLDQTALDSAILLQGLIWFSPLSCDSCFSRVSVGEFCLATQVINQPSFVHQADVTSQKNATTRVLLHQSPFPDFGNPC